MTINDATRAQIRAADPTVSTWVSANAGSGKTRVLTDRVARLLLRGTDPQKILCLTYTKAAAAEMQNRLFQRLGAWAMMPDTILRDTLADLGEERTDLGHEKLRVARTLFANALETPGGLKIQTIHSFCDKLLRQFPLEAGVSPQFEVLEDRQAKLLREEVLEELADGGDVPAVDALARFVGGDDPDNLLSELVSKRGAVLHPVEAATFGVEPTDSLESVCATLMTANAKVLLNDLIEVMENGLATDVKHANILKSTLQLTDSNKLLSTLESVFLYKTSTKFGPNSPKLDAVPTKNLRSENPDLSLRVNDFMRLVQVGRTKRVGLLAFARADALHSFARSFLKEYDRRKSLSGRLDYDDLIRLANALLGDSDSAQWILYKLDGGIDHILVDEAQDTSPAQWSVISHLAEEFTSGQGASVAERTIFVVGDEKQSIYSFQGADPAEFSRMRDRFEDRFFQMNNRLEHQDLLYSFRSADPILRLVDAVFDGPAGDGLKSDIRHRAFKSEKPGCVDIWPFLEIENTSDDSPWYEPVDSPTADDPRAALAKRIAAWISSVLASKQRMPGCSPTRPVAPGDFLILVQTRGPLFRHIIKELKNQEIPVAGADRLDIGQELAVRDILSLLKFADLPEDDLSLAEALRSPLLSVTEGQLFTLAHGRKGSLWQNLRAQGSVHPLVLEKLWKILNQTDFLRPYEFIELILTELKGRENLIARLGSEIEDGINELLSQALHYEQLEVPTLAGFLHWFQSGNVVIKREMDSARDQVRVMTVHGAKGLESQIIILPDTAKRTPRDRDQIIALTDGSALWKTDKENATDAQLVAMEARKTFEQQERMRLLYVAMTRAESWLVVCGAGDIGKDGTSWYQLVSHGMQDLAVLERDIPEVGASKSLEFNWNTDPAEPKLAETSAVEVLPAWLTTLAEIPDRPEQTISPSKLEGTKAIFSEGPEAIVESEQDALRKGRQVHRLLEHLPGCPVSERAEQARKLLVSADTPESEQEFRAVLAETEKVLDDSELAFLFARNTLAEVGITARLPDLNNVRIDGVIDRLIIQEDRILAIDFKTNAVVPDAPTQTPLGVLRQLGTYASALGQIYPDRRIELAVLWTATGTLMSIPHDIMMNALRFTATS